MSEQANPSALSLAAQSSAQLLVIISSVWTADTASNVASRFQEVENFKVCGSEMRNVAKPNRYVISVSIGYACTHGNCCWIILQKASAAQSVYEKSGYQLWKTRKNY